MLTKDDVYSSQRHQVHTGSEMALRSADQNSIQTRRLLHGTIANDQGTVLPVPLRRIWHRRIHFPGPQRHGDADVSTRHSRLPSRVANDFPWTQLLTVYVPSDILALAPLMERVLIQARHRTSRGLYYSSRARSSAHASIVKAYSRCIQCQ